MFEGLPLILNPQGGAGLGEEHLVEVEDHLLEHFARDSWGGATQWRCHACSFASPTTKTRGTKLKSAERRLCPCTPDGAAAGARAFLADICLGLYHQLRQISQRVEAVPNLSEGHTITITCKPTRFFIPTARKARYGQRGTRRTWDFTSFGPFARTRSAAARSDEARSSRHRSGCTAFFKKASASHWSIPFRRISLERLFLLVAASVGGRRGRGN